MLILKVGLQNSIKSNLKIKSYWSNFLQPLFYIILNERMVGRPFISLQTNFLYM